MSGITDNTGTGLYQHQLAAGIHSPLQPSKIVCVGRNYAEHAKELGNPIDSTPILFIKPGTAAVAMAGEISIPKDRGQVHHELEMAVLIGKPLSGVSTAQASAAIIGLGLAYDLTLRDIQNELKQKSHPWERAKAFDGSCPLSPFVSAAGVEWQSLDIELKRNGKVQQRGNTADMLFPVLQLVAHISEVFTLLPGDVVLTGTPAGVGPLQVGDRLEAALGSLLRVESRVFSDRPTKNYRRRSLGNYAECRASAATGYCLQLQP